MFGKLGSSFFMVFILLCCMIGASDGPATKSSESPAAHRSAGILPKAPTSLQAPLISDPLPPSSPAKGMLVL